MMGDKSISPEKVPYLWLLLIKKKWNVTEISRKLKIARSCVYTYKKRRISDIPNKKPNKGGRPKKINERDMRKLLRTIKSLREREGTFIQETC